jgi:cyclic beta-1,2-glucan synthetase
VHPEAESEEPILAELFSVERLEQHARTLAAAQVVTNTPRRGHAVGPRIAENGRVLLESYRVLASAIKDERSITPAAEWLVDNFHVVDEQLREIRDDLPPDYYRELPKLAQGHLAGYPRVMGLAWAYIAHTDSRFEPESLRRMVRAYQGVEPLTIGELWAIAISLRILLVDNLRRIAEEIVLSRAARQKADDLADGLLGLGPDSPEVPASALARDAADGGSRPALPAPARSGPCGHPRPPLAGGASRCPGDQRRGDGPHRAPAPGDGERDGPKRDHEHAPHLVVRLGPVRRKRQPGR